MSMELILVQVDNELLNKIKEDPTVLEQIVFEESYVHPTLDYTKHVRYSDYLTWTGLYSAIAQQAGDDPEEYTESEAVQNSPIYRAVDGSDESEYLEDCAGLFTYEHCMLNHTDEVKKIAQELKEFIDKSDFTKELTEADKKDEEFILIGEYLFYEKAAAENKSVICCIN